ncbi:MAG: pyridoxal-dependent decarboxylase [Acidimicrobiales bacterium]
MTPEEFRSAGHELIDWIADLRENVADMPVLAQVSPGEVRSKFSIEPPAETVSFESLLTEVEAKVLPGITQMQHPMNYGWFPANASLASVLGDIASSGISSIGISWESSPALTEVEEVVCNWMRQLVGLSDSWRGTIQDTASSACLVALLVARERACDLAQNRGGTQSLESPLVVYSTPQAHSSVAKAALLAGFGWDNIHMVDVDPNSYAMKADSLAEAMVADVAAGKIPAAVVAAVGTTGTTAMDPVADIVTVASRHNVFVHVDAAMAGTAMLLPECRHLWEGVEGADSISWNPHKWMGTILDTSLFYVRDVALLERVMSTNPSYLQSTADGAVTQYRDWGIPLGRRFRALKLLFHLRLDGIESVRERVRGDLANAKWLEAQVRHADQWQLCAPVDLQTVCVRHVPGGLADEALDEHTLGWVRHINDSGAAFLTPSILDGRWMARVSIGVMSTERSHVEQLWELMTEAANNHRSAT